MGEIETTRMITVEGGDGTFKTDTGKMAIQVLEGLGVEVVDYERIPGEPIPDFPKDRPILMYLREPGGSVPGKDTRRILLESDYSAKLFPPAYVMGYFFDRGISIGMLAEFMEQYPNAIVFQDRCHWTTLTMQLYDAMRKGEVDLDVTRSGLGMIDTGFWILVKQQLGVDSPYPGHVLTFDASERELVVRNGMGKSTVKNWRDKDAIEGKRFIREEYLRLIQLHPRSSKAINTHVPPEQLLTNVTQSIISVLPSQILAQLDLTDIKSVIDLVLARNSMEDKWTLYQDERQIQSLRGIESTLPEVYDTWARFGISPSGYVDP